MADRGSQGGENKRRFGDTDRSWNDENSGGVCVDPQDLRAKRARVSGQGDGVQEREGGENLGGSGEGIEERQLGNDPMVTDEDLEPENRERGPDHSISPTGTSAIDRYSQDETRFGKRIAEEREELPGPERAEVEEGVRLSYTREEKGKGKAVDHPMPDANAQMEIGRRVGGGVRIGTNESEGGQNNMGRIAAEGSVGRPSQPGGLNAEANRAMVSDTSELQDINQSRENMEPTENFMLLMQRALSFAIQNAAKRRERDANYRKMARSSLAQLGEAGCDSLSKVQQPSLSSDKGEDPFPKALWRVRARKLAAERNDQQLIEWGPLPQNHNTQRRLAPSLVDVCVDFLAKNSDAILSLEHIPDVLMHKISRAICRGRRMNPHFVELLLRGSSTEIRLDDCSWMTEQQFTNLFRGLQNRNLTVLQLDLCGECMTPSTLRATIAQSFMPALAKVSLRGACRLSDEGIDSLVRSVPVLQSLNLGQCSLLTHSAINFVADKLAHILKELFIDDCPKINAMLILPALKEFKCLEVLSVSGIQTVCDGFISEIVTYLGSNMKELVLTNCCKITDGSLEAIGHNCPSLSAIDLSNLGLLTDTALQSLANGCRSIQTLRLCRNNFSDEAIAAFLETSVESLKHLSLNHCSEVGDQTARSLSECQRNLLTLDLSWCCNLNEEAFGLIVDKCSLLRLLKVFGCIQITNRFIYGHRNADVGINGLWGPNKVLGHLDLIEPLGPLRYSSVTYYGNAQQSDVS